MNLPNLLSLLRIVITFFFILVAYHDRLDYALCLFILQGVTDLLDGFIARTMGKKTDLGAYLDPIADKTMLIGAFIVLSVKGFIPLWLPVLIISKDIGIAIGFFVLYRLVGSTKPVPSIFGKFSTTCQIMTILYVLCVEIASWANGRVYSKVFFYVTACVTLLAGLHYIYYGIQTLRACKSTPKSPA